MTAKRQKKEKDVIDLMLDQLDFHGMPKDELTGKETCQVLVDTLN